MPSLLETGLHFMDIRDENERLRESYELAEEAALFLLRTAHWIRQKDRDRALAMLDRARAGAKSRRQGHVEMLL